MSRPRMSVVVFGSSLVALALALAVAPSSLAAQARAPYLQSPTETSIVVAWRSAANEPTRVCWGTSMASLTNTAGTGTSETNHIVRITGLAPATQYFYAAARAACPGAAGDARDTFRTAPLRGATTPFRMWVVGDSGTGGTRQGQVRDAMLAATTTRRPDLFLHMGDMAYNTGTTGEFTANFFAMYATVLRNTAVWPTMGNHEGSSADSGTQTGPYYDAYVLPTDGSAGGLASGTEAYYAFDWGNVHFVVLDSHDSPRTAAGAMLTWLDADLAATDQPWIVAFFHHPPYTDGSHDSDTESQLVQMRQNAGPILEAHGVDLVLAGHSHIYERSWLLRGAFETPTTAAGNIADMGDGRLDGDGAYRSGTDGTLYVVAGHGGAGVSGSANHPVMFFSEVANGSCLIDVDDQEMTLRNIRWDGVETDHVTLIKRDGLFLARPMGGERYAVGSTVSIAWSSAGAIAAVRIESSLDGGTTWTDVVASTANDGAHDWITPATATERARIRISSVADATLTDASGDFALSTDTSMVAIPFGEIWQYSDDGTDLGDTWRRGEGATWREGPAELGYGEGDEATVLQDDIINVPTVYFRRRIDVTGEVTTARLRATYDDGIAVWVNGTLVTQEAIGSLDHDAYASASTTDELMLDRMLNLSGANPFVEGENWVSAIVKQSSATSSDVSFDLELTLGLRGTLPDGGIATDGGGAPLDSGAAGGDGAVTVDGSSGGSDSGGGEGRVDGGGGGGSGDGCGCRTVGHRASGAPFALVVTLLGLVIARRRRAR